MPIIESVIVSTSLQVDGSTLVHERHTDHRGIAHEVQYYAPAEFDINAVMRARAVNIGVEVDKREAVAAEAANFEIALSPVEFMARFTPLEWVAFEALAQSDAQAKYLWLLVQKSTSFNRGNPRLVGGLQYLAANGVLLPERIAEVLA